MDPIKDLCATLSFTSIAGTVESLVAFKMTFLLVILCFATAPLVIGEEMKSKIYFSSIHKRMTTEEVAQIFQTTHDSVPDYEVVRFHVSRLIKRGSRTARALRVKAFGDDFKLFLQPTEGILVGNDTPVLITTKDASGKIIYDNYSNGTNNVYTLLEDTEMKASLIEAKDSQGLYSINGYIASKKLVIRSLPASIIDDLSIYRSFNNSKTSLNSKGLRLAYHIVFKKEVKRVEESKKSFNFNQTRTRISRSNAIPEVVYPEIMVVVDSTFLSINNNDIDKVLAYVVTFWNGVDLMYRSFEGPKFRFNIARIIIAKEQDAVPYISESMVNPTIYNAYDALGFAENYYFELLDKFPSNSYDAVVTMSRLDMGNGSVHPDILGIMSKRGGACLVDYTEKKMMNVALITDTGSFDGIFTAAHEFAHLLGAGHDDWFTCKPKDGYIMSSTSGMTEHSHDFSVCSVEDIQEYLNNNGGFCLYNIPMKADPLPRILPGQLRDRDHQCKMLGRGKSCYSMSEAKKHLPCTAIYCEDPEDASRCLETKENVPADGAFCFPGNVCLHGNCVFI